MLRDELEAHFVKRMGAKAQAESYGYLMYRTYGAQTDCDMTFVMRATIEKECNHNRQKVLLSICSLPVWGNIVKSV